MGAEHREPDAAVAESRTREGAPRDPAGSTPAAVALGPGHGNLLTLQRRAGNRAVAAAVGSAAPRGPRPTVQRPTVQRDGPPAPAAPAPAAPTSFFYAGYPLTPDADNLVGLLNAVSAEKGTLAAAELNNTVVNMDPGTNLGLQGKGIPADLITRTQTAMTAAYARFKQANDQFLTTFQTEAEALVRRLLDESEKRVKSEQSRYLTTKWGFIAAENVPETGPLRQAAGALAGKRRAVDALGRTSASSLGALDKARAASPFLVDPKLTEAFDRDREAWMAGEKEYAEQCRPQHERMPFLAVFTDNEDMKAASKLESLTTMDGGDLVNKVIQEGNTRERNIIEVRADLGKSLTVWKQDRIRTMTLAQLNATPVQHKLVDEKVAAVKEADEESEKLREAIMIGLGVAALVLTGGAALGGGAVLATGAEVAGIAATGMTIAKVWKDVAAYERDKAAANTDFDRARAISADDPSFAWVAQELVAAAFETAAAITSFGTIVRTIKGLSTAESLIGSVATLEQAAGPAAAKVLPRVLAAAEQEGVLQRLIEAEGKAFKGHDLGYVEQLLDQHFGREVADSYAVLSADGKIRPLTQEALEESLGHLPSQHGNSDLAADYILKHKVLQGGGVFSPETGIIFVRPGLEAEFTSIVVHEMVHAKQAKDGVKYFQFLEEFEAYAAQRAVLKRLQQYGYSPGSLQWLAEATDQSIALHIKTGYGYPIPPWIDKTQFTTMQVVFRNALPKLKKL